MSHYKAYSAYKHSGVEWLGDVPEHWEVKRIKHTTYLKGRVGWKGLTSDEYLDTGYAYLVTGTDFGAKLISWSECHYIDQSRYEDDPFIQLRNGDLLITKDGTIGKLALVSGLDKPACLNSGIFLIRPENSYSTEFLYWVLSSKVFSDFCDISNSGSTIQHLYQNVFENFAFPTPSFSSQKDITIHLDRETARIDSLVSRKTRFIELLREKRQALITHAVTKGLDPTVNMKDSGVEWLGQVPVHWKVLPIKNIVAKPITDGPHETPVFVDKGIPFVSAEAISSGQINFEKIRGYITEEAHRQYSQKYHPQRGDIFMIKSGATTGITAMVDTDIDFNIWSPLAVIRCGTNSDPRFVLSYMRSRNFQDAIELNWSYGTQQNIGMGVIGNLAITIPPIEEQIKIASHIDRQATRIDMLINRTERSIELLKERRSALITAAVTGQIDLREAA